MKRVITKGEKNLQREKFIIQFCKARGWNYNELTTGQMLILVKQKGY